MLIAEKKNESVFCQIAYTNGYLAGFQYVFKCRQIILV